MQRLLFSVYRDGARRLLIRYVALWRDDGGFVIDDDFGCGDAHEGDAQGLSVSAEIVAGSEAWFVRPLGMSAGGQTTVDGTGDARTELAGTHPILYASAGKHHYYPHSAYDCSPVTGGCCWDSADGLGPRVTPGQGRGLISHVPAQHETIVTEVVDESGQPILTTTERVFFNACTFQRNGTKVSPSGFQGNDLGNLGYSGQNLWEHFYSGTADPAGPQRLQPVQRDNDGDGIADTFAFTFDSKGGVVGVALPADHCPWDFGEADADQDGLTASCDPDPRYRNKYVAGGSASLPPHRPGVDVLPPWMPFQSKASLAEPYHGRVFSTPIRMVLLMARTSVRRKPAGRKICETPTRGRKRYSSRAIREQAIWGASIAVIVAIPIQRRRRAGSIRVKRNSSEGSVV